MSINAINELNKKLAHYRERKGMSLRDLSKISGVDHTTISGMEQGRIKPPKGALEKLAIALNLSEEEAGNLSVLVAQLPTIKRLKSNTRGLESSILIRALCLLTSTPRSEIKEVWLQESAGDEYDAVLKLKRGVLGIKIGVPGEFWSAEGFSQDDLPPPSRATRKQFVTRGSFAP